MSKENMENNDTGESRFSPTRSNVLQFFGGIILFLVGATLITQNTVIHMNFNLISNLLGFNVPFGLVILPLLVGIGILFFSSKSVLGWVVTIFGILTILLIILMALDIYFKPVSLYYGILMYGMAAAGIGLFIKSLFGRKR